ncbi:MAG: polymer-forming cytoskeletal protein [Steroidobacteraceae bacterium]|nr:polymer-forming cytoskeletal protein [Steroidobacteraceae bacterium]
MSDAPKPRRRLFDRASGVPTLLGEGSRFEGRVATTGPLTLAGELVGDGEIRGLLSVMPGAHWQGDGVARNAVIAGRVTGDLVVTEKLEIGKTAVVRGNVRAKSLAIAHGAVVDGELSITGTEPVVRFEEKRASRLT